MEEHMLLLFFRTAAPWVMAASIVADLRGREQDLVILSVYIHLVDNLRSRVARAQEVGVQGVSGALTVDRSNGRIESLGQYLAAEYPARDARALADEDIFVELLNLQVGQQFFQVVHYQSLC